MKRKPRAILNCQYCFQGVLRGGRMMVTRDVLIWGYLRIRYLMVICAQVEEMKGV